MADDRKITVTKHAVETYARRKNDRRPAKVIAAEIRECVAIAIERGNIYDQRPDGYLLYGRKRRDMPAGQRFVRCDEESNYGFVIKRTTDEGDIVITTLTKAGVNKRA